MIRALCSAAITAACILSTPAMALAASQEPDATIELSGGTVAVGVGYSWGKGTLHYQGQAIPVKVKGLSVASVGAESIRASGDVYHLANLQDFAGNYTAVSAGATVAGGGEATAMQNQNGVVIKLRSTTQGLAFNLSVEGVAISLNK